MPVIFTLEDQAPFLLEAFLSVALSLPVFVMMKGETNKKYWIICIKEKNGRGGGSDLVYSLFAKS